MSKILNQMKEKLVEIFDEAAKNAKSCWGAEEKARFMTASAALAEAITKIEQEQRLQAGPSEFHETALTLAESLEQVLARLTKTEKALGLAPEEEKPAAEEKPALPKPGQAIPRL